jgi:hypothetical protein
MTFQHNKSRGEPNLYINDKPLPQYPSSSDPRDTLKKNIIKPTRDFSTFRKPIVTIITTTNNSDIINNERPKNVFMRGMIEKVSGPINNCSSCGGAK